MAKPRTHQERAERAARAIRPHSMEGTVGERFDHEMVELTAPIIARETFPTELVQAATELLELRFVNRPKRVELRIERRMKSVLALYPTEETK